MSVSGKPSVIQAKAIWDVCNICLLFTIITQCDLLYHDK